MCGPRWGHQLRRAAMAEQTSTANVTDWQRKQGNWVDNKDRPPLFKVVRGYVLKGYQVTILGAERNRADLRPSDRVLVRSEAWGATQAQEGLVVYRNLERAWRTRAEEPLGREFPEDEAADHERGMRLRVATPHVGTPSEEHQQQAGADGTAPAAGERGDAAAQRDRVRARPEGLPGAAQDG